MVDMHGGGGCAEGHGRYSGFKQMVDKHGGVMVWPQAGPGTGNQWQVGGHDTATMDDKGKGKIETDDIGFLRKLVSAAVAADEALIDPTKIYFGGFSMGAMMAQRFAYDASGFVSAVGCHGGPLISGAETAPEGMRPTPIMLVCGELDGWCPEDKLGNFRDYFQCAKTETTTVTPGSSARAGRSRGPRSVPPPSLSPTRPRRSRPVSAAWVVRAGPSSCARRARGPGSQPIASASCPRAPNAPVPVALRVVACRRDLLCTGRVRR